MNTTYEDDSQDHANDDTKRPSYIVGIGASAGGLEALESVFENMPADTGMAFVIVQHLSPDFKSVMGELLGRKTRIPTQSVEDSMEVEANQIYLIPPRKDMIISSGKLLLKDKDPKQVVSLPIDNFFRSLAQDARERAIGIILSGTGSDGSRGIREIHDAGGLVIVQSPETAKFDGMPNSAKLTGSVDLVLGPEQIPDALVTFDNEGLWKLQEANSEPDTQGAMGAIFRMLRDEMGIDFSHYKVNTISRRIDRRLMLNRINELDEYVQFLRDNRDELSLLYKDLLIGVTRFLRDAEAFEKLEKDILPELISQKSDGDELRIWVAGCATGEEAYSVAIAVRSCLDQVNRKLNVKIFATDVHRASIEYASAASYGEEQLTELGQERLGKFFVSKNGAFQVNSEIRQLVVFAQHNLLKDAPFTKLDLVTCRNVLIYLQPQLQKKVLSFFHFALNTGGVLFLGPSETPGELEDEFSVCDPHWKIYRKRRETRIPPDMRLPLSMGSPVTSRAAERPRGGVSHAEVVDVFSGIIEQLLPPSMLVDERNHLVHTTGDAHQFLNFRKGPVSVNVLDLVDPEIKTLLSAGLVRAQSEKTVIAYKSIYIRRGDEERQIDLTIRPHVSKRTNVYHALISLSDRGGAPTPTISPADIDMTRASQEQLASVEHELRHAKENLQATIEELETSNEELQATNEELVASNEELQSTNEELHSVNEELYSVNAEFQKKITELTELTDDMENLMEGSQVYTLFLDRNLCIRKFTPRIAEVFNLLPQDVGRRIETFVHNIECPTLVADCNEVVRSDKVIEVPVNDTAHHRYIMRIQPYRAKSGFDGVVLTLVDITSLRDANAKIRQKELQLSAILTNSPHLVTIKDLQGRYVVCDAAFQKLAPVDPIGKTNHDLFTPELAGLLDRLDQQVTSEGSSLETEIEIPQSDGLHSYLTIKSPWRNETGEVVGVSTIKTDVTRLKRAEAEAREALAQRDRFLAVLSHELRNPLGAIVNAASLLESTAVDRERRTDAVGILLRQARQMGRLLDDLLDLSRITQDKFHLDRKVVSLKSVLEEAIRVAQPYFKKARVNFVYVESADIPPTVNGDAARLQQLIVNLLTNAAKYTPAGGEARLSLSRAQGNAEIRVRDTGIGMKPEVLSQIFDLFVQAENTPDHRQDGLGVGLSLVRAIAHLHDGSVTACSDGIGKGSEFIVRLPVLSDSVAEHEISTQDSERSQSSTNHAMGTIVIAEDNEDGRQMLEALLKLHISDVYSTNNGRDAVEMIVQRRPRLAIVDIGLPILNGYEVAQAVRKELGNTVYLVALTGYGRDSDRKQVIEAGFDQHLVKPLLGDQLNSIINRMRSNHQDHSDA